MSEQLTKIYGIDLGTTYSCIAHVDEHGKPVVIPNSESERITPSVVFFDGDNVIVGNEAKRNAVLSSDQVVAFVKRSMGDPNFLFQYNGKSYKPEEISSFILRKLVSDAEQITGEKINDVVITCPAYFGINEREATKIAGDIAGLNVRQIINEPTAAAISYGMAEKTGKKVVLVYDLGGGTFDITMIDIKPESIEVICTGGSHQLGGKDWDDALLQYLVTQFQQETNTTDDILEDPDTCQNLQLGAESAKKALAVREKTRIPIVYGGDKVGVELTREKFDEITQNLLERTITYSHDMLAEAKKKGYNAFDEILLVGGATRMPQVMERIKTEFSMEPKLFDPDEAVAKGAALYGWKLSVNDELIRRVAAETGKSVEEIKEAPQEESLDEIIEKAAQEFADESGLTLGAVKSAGIEVKNVCSKSFGVVAVDRDDAEIVDNLILRNTTVPTDVAQRYGTHHPNQENVNVRIMENEVSEKTNPPGKSTEIGNAVLELPANLPANSPIDVTFSLNQEGRLDVTAVEATENRKIDITIKTNSILQGEELEAAKAKSQSLAVL
jgi:molecular chaperone DnaK (HSP70)